MVLSSLPEETQVDIFLKLPINSLVACRHVCKIWRKLICSPNFNKTHLEHGIRNPKLMLQSCNIHNLKCLFCSIDYDSISSALSTSSTTCTCDVDIPMGYIFQDMFHSSTRMLGSGNGLICMTLNWQEDTHICIWNPSTGESRIAPLPCNDFFLSEKHCSLGYVFYYDCTADDYKLVRIAEINKSKYTAGSYQVDVYTVGSKSWSSRKRTVSINHHYMSPAVQELSVYFVKGALHWIGVNKIFGVSSKVVVSFDVRSERFVDILFPKEVQNQVISCVGVLEDCLYLGFYHTNNNRIDIWLMQDYGVGEPWTKRHSFVTTNMTVDSEWKLLWSFTDGELLIYNGGNKLYICDSKKDRFRDLKINGVSNYFMVNSVMLNFVGSLVSPN